MKLLIAPHVWMVIVDYLIFWWSHICGWYSCLFKPFAIYWSYLYYKIFVGE
jgi:hypothetical protein